MIPDFKDSEKDKIEIASTVSAIEDDVVHLVKVSGQRRQNHQLMIAG